MHGRGIILARKVVTVIYSQGFGIVILAEQGLGI